MTLEMNKRPELNVTHYDQTPDGYVTLERLAELAWEHGEGGLTRNGAYLYIRAHQIPVVVVGKTVLVRPEEFWAVREQVGKTEGF